MKTITFINLVLSPLLVLLLANNSRAQGPVSAGLIAHYCFDGNADDAVGKKHGTVNGAALTTDRLGRANSAYSFDGLDDYIQLPNDVWISGDFTIAGWLRVDSYKGFGRFYEFGNGTPGDNVVYSPTPTGASTTNDAFIIRRNSCSAAAAEESANAGPFPYSTWVHVVTVFKGLTGSVWRNGLNVTIATTGFTAPPCSVLRTGCYFGKSAWSLDEYFQGKMDDIRIYNRALDALEIDTLYTLNKTCQQLSSIQTKASALDFFLSQNAPNPSINGTLIKYKLPVGSKNAQIQIVDITGKTIANYTLDQKEGEASILTSHLQSGLYFYSLYSDGKVLDRKKMLIQ